MVNQYSQCPVLSVRKLHKNGVTLQLLITVVALSLESGLEQTHRRTVIKAAWRMLEGLHMLCLCRFLTTRL